MSKSLVKQGTQKQIFSILEAQLNRQDEQGKTIHTMFDSVKVMYHDFSQKFETMTEMVQEVRDSVTLNDAERTTLQSDVATKSIELAKDRHNEGEERFSKVVGYYRHMIWKSLKAKYQVPKYHCIRRVDYQDSREFVQSFRPEDNI
jgi:hypothetical protein